MLSNPIYQDKLHYIPAVYPARTKYIISEYAETLQRNCTVDLIREVVDFAFIPDSKAKDLQFDTEVLVQKVKTSKDQDLEYDQAEFSTNLQD